VGRPNRSISYTVATFAVLATGACSSVATPAAQAPTSCLDASDAAIQASDMGDGWCGGEISVSGSTPLGPFCPTQIQASVGGSLCFGGLSVALADGGGILSNQVLVLSDLRFDRAQGSWVGTQQVNAYLSKQTGQPLVFPTTVEVTASDNPYLADASVPATTTPAGEIHLRFAMQSSAGLLSGTLVARYCEWASCLP
jgi:hypothetical protein